MTTIDLDAIMTKAAAEVAEKFTPKPGLTSFANAVLKMQAIEKAQVAALMDAGATEADLEARSSGSPTTRPERTDADREEWRASRERGARIRVDHLTRKLERLEARKPVAIDRAAAGGNTHPSIPKRLERDTDRMARTAAEIERTKTALAYARERADYWANWKKETPNV